MKRRLCLFIGLVLTAFLCLILINIPSMSIRNDIGVKTTNPQVGNEQIMIYTTEFDGGGYSKTSSIIVDSKEGDYLTLKIEDDYQDIELYVGEDSYTCKVASSVNRNDFVNDINQIVENNEMNAEEYLDKLMKEGKVVFYMTGIVEEGVKDGKVYHDGNSTTYEIK